MKKITEHFFYVSKHRNHLYFKVLIMFNVVLILLLIYNAYIHANDALRDSVNNVLNAVFEQESREATVPTFRQFHQGLISYFEVR